MQPIADARAADAVDETLQYPAIAGSIADPQAVFGPTRRVLRGGERANARHDDDEAAAIANPEAPATQTVAS